MISEDSIRSGLVRIVARIINVDQRDISGEETLEMLGIDSAATISLASQVEEQYGVLIEPQDVAADATIREMSQQISRRLQRASNRS